MKDGEPKPTHKYDSGRQLRLQPFLPLVALLLPQ